MKIREYQLKELSEARKLQDELAKLHVPSPVLSWAYEIKDADGTIAEKGIGKSNSFTRNALNAMAYCVGLADYNICSSVSFADGVISRKNASTGEVGSPNIASSYFRNSNSNPIVYVGGDSTAESLDSYTIPATTLTVANNTTAVSAFNASSRKMITLMKRTYYNGTGSTVNIVESGISITGYTSAPLLMVRDVFTSISVAAGQTIEWTYATEVAYPNP